MTFEEFVTAAEQLDLIRKRKKELEEEENRLKVEIIEYMDKNQVDRVKINDQQTVSIQTRVHRREYDLDQASRILSPDVFQSVLQINNSKIQQLIKEGIVSETDYRKMLNREQTAKYILIK